jgi:hypothetical protein
MNSMHRFLSPAAAMLGAWLCLVANSPARAGILITIDKAAQRMAVAVDGVPRWSWPVSTGRRGYDTPAGSFTPFRMEEDHYSKEWDDAPMPYSIFFTEGGHAIHGSYETRNLGRRASHGCVRLAPRNAAKLFALVQRRGLSNARVVVKGDPNAPIVAKRRAPKPAPLQEARAPAPPPFAVSPPETQPPAPAPEQAYGYAPALPPEDVATGVIPQPLQLEPPPMWDQ